MLLLQVPTQRVRAFILSQFKRRSSYLAGLPQVSAVYSTLPYLGVTWALGTSATISVSPSPLLTTLS